MQKFILQEHTQEQRDAILAASKKKERITYTRNLTEAEIDNESKKLAAEVKTLARQEEEKKEVMREYKDSIDRTRERMENISKTLLDGTKEVTEECLKVLNIEGREVGFYNRSGELVKVRPMIDDDVQMDLFDDNSQQAAALEQHVEDAEAEEISDDDLDLYEEQLINS